MSERFLWSIIAVLLILLAGVAAWKIWLLRFPEISATAPLNTTCNLHQTTCRTHFPDGGEVSLSITPQPIPVLASLDVQVNLQQLQAAQVEVDFAGVEMSMGYQRPMLEKRSAHGFAGKAVLPVCITERMTWQATVMLHTEKGLYAAPFQFVIAR